MGMEHGPRRRRNSGNCRGKRRRIGVLLAALAALSVRAASALTAPTPVAISPPGNICHDFPDVLVTNPGVSALAVWTGYDFTPDNDELYLATLNGAAWTTGSGTGITGDLYSPRLGDAGAAGARIVWSQQLAGNWDLYARDITGGAITRLTTDAGSDTNAATASDPARNRCFVVWQGFRNGRSAIFLTQFDGGGWSAAKTVSQPAANEWFPKAAVDSMGRVWVVWDSYRDGNYDVFLRSYLPDTGAFGPEIRVTAGPKYEANATVACDADNRVWMTWETGAANWGKDQGRLTTAGEGPRLTMPTGGKFVDERRVGVAVYDGAAIKTPVASVDTLYPAAPNNTFDPIMAVDAWDRPWVFHARRVNFGSGTNSTWAGWRYAMTRYDDSVTTWSWDAAVVIPNSLDRIERKLAVAPYDAGRLLAVWHVDGRAKTTNAADMRHGPPDGNKIYAAFVDVPAETNVDPALTDPAVDPPATPSHPTEPADVAAIRAYRTMIDGKTYRIVRGDLHRHNDISWDGNGDGSLEDLFRYAYDAGALDFVMPSDHHSQLTTQQGSIPGNLRYPDWNYYPWHRTQKLDDVYYSAGVMTPCYGYERSRTYPDGHRNIIFPVRSPRGEWIVESSPTTPLGSDQNYLYNLIKPRGGIAIAHTPGDEMGTSWNYDVDYGAERVLEIYQGCRYSFEYYTTAPVHWPNIDIREAPTGNEEIHPDGFYFAMLQQRLANNDYKKKLGIISSSDHGSTHLSYACLYVEEFTRQGIIDAIQARHTYGAMDNIILDVSCGAAMMGDEVVVSRVPTLRIFVDAPKPLNEIAVIRDNAVVYSYNPIQRGDADPSRFDSEWTDDNCAPGYHYYYIRVRQNDGRVELDDSQIDGTLAWSSPIWLQRVDRPASRWQLH